MRVAAFHGVRYAPTAVDDLAAVTAPPYDAIDTSLQQALHEASPYNVVRLELGMELDTDDGLANRYTRAARQYQAWRRDGVLIADAPHPRMHVYEQVFTDDGVERRQIGLLAALGLAPWEHGEVVPHERVFRGPVEDRKRLLRALPVNVSPVFVVYPGRPAAVEEAIATAAAGPPTHDFRCDDDVHHRLWPLGEQAVMAAVTAALEDRVGLMADGHHRYTTALEVHREGPPVPGSGSVLAYVVAEEDGPVVRATHRLVRRLPLRWRTLLEEAGAEVARSWEGPRPDLALRELNSGGLAFGLVTRQRTEILRGEAMRRVLSSDTPAETAGLDVTVLQSLLVDHLGVPDRIEDLRYTADVGEALTAIGRGDYEALFLVDPVTLPEVRAAAEAGVRLPPKSTFFHPKPRTGLVLRPLDPDNDV